MAENVKVVTVNRKARHDYHVLERFEAGIVLLGTEVKALRNGRANLKDSYASLEGNELFLHNCHIGPYPPAGPYNQHEPERPRKLLLHRYEIERLIGKTQQRGQTLVPLRVYFKGPRAKVELALATGKEGRDRRREIRDREVRREVERDMRHRMR